MKVQKETLGSTLAKILFYVVTGVIFAWTASNTMEFIARALPRIELARYFGLILFDGGAIAWLIIFLKGAKGLMQRGISVGMAIVDLIGTILIVVAEIFTGGQQIAVAPEQLETIALWSIGIWTGINLFAVFMYHITDPSTQFEMSQRAAIDKLQAKALQVFDERTEEISARVSDALTEDYMRQALTSLGVTADSIGLHLPNRNGHKPAPQLPQPASADPEPGQLIPTDYRDVNYRRVLGTIQDGKTSYWVRTPTGLQPAVKPWNYYSLADEDEEARQRKRATEERMNRLAEQNPRTTGRPPHYHPLAGDEPAATDEPPHYHPNAVPPDFDVDAALDEAEAKVKYTAPTPPAPNGRQERPQR